MTEKERYATIGTWVEVFRKEGADVNAETLRYRLRIAKTVGVTARNKIGRVVREGYYPEALVRGMLEDLMKAPDQADENGLFERNGETYGTIPGLARLLGVSGKFLRNNVKNGDQKSVAGRDYLGRLQQFYSLSDVKNSVTEDNMRLLLYADENGFIVKDGNTYGTAESLARFLNVSASAIRVRINEKSLTPVKALDQTRQKRDFYDLHEVRALCEDSLIHLPVADKSGVIEQCGVRYGTLAVLSRMVGLSFPSLKERVDKSSISPIFGRDQGGRLFDFYPLPDVQQLFEDHLQGFPMADSDGFIEKDGELYGTVGSISSRVKISSRAILLRIRKNGLPFIYGKDRRNRVKNFYSLSVVLKLMSKKSND